MASVGEDNVIRKPPSHLRTLHEKDQEKRLIVILESASLEVVKVGKDYQLLNCDDHQGLIKKYKKGREINSCRPDIAHQSLLHLLDSPLNQAGLLQVFIRTETNVLIQIDSQTRIPRTFGQFCPLMVQLLHKYSIQAKDGKKKLIKIIKNPVVNHLPTGCPKVLLSVHGERADISDLIPDDRPIVFVIGALARGSVSVDYTERTVSLGEYPLSAALTCAKLTTACEEKWGIF